MTRQPSAASGAPARAWVEVDLDAIRRNARVAADYAGIPILPMVKADAYGLGAVRVAKALEAVGPWGFGVATVAEGEQLRASGIALPILVFTPLLEEELERAARARLSPTLATLSAIQRWAPTGRPWHLAIDTGMSRQGVRWDELDALRAALTHHPPEGAFTHFHSADKDDDSLDIQEHRFRTAVASLPGRPRLLHASNSAAIARRDQSQYDLARPGIFLYGGGTGAGAVIEPEPVARLRAPVVEIREIRDGETVSYGATWRADGPRRIATLAVGYADGYRRSLGSRAFALINGHRAPVAGVVTMDMTMIDITGAPCAVGDVATLLGREGDDAIPVDELATLAGTISYELLVSLRLRAERVYLGGA